MKPSAQIEPLRLLLRRLRSRPPEPPLLADLESSFARELERLLQKKRRRRLAMLVPKLRVVESCECGDPRCASFYVVPQFVLRWRWPGRRETLDLGASQGTICRCKDNRFVTLFDESLIGL